MKPIGTITVPPGLAGGAQNLVLRVAVILFITLLDEWNRGELDKGDLADVKGYITNIWVLSLAELPRKVSPRDFGEPVVNTSSATQPSQGQSPNSASNSRSTSPVRPAYSPITPVLGSAPLATSAISPNTIPNGAGPPRQTYTHSQPPQHDIPHPPPEPITLESNPDAIALRSAIAILQLQSRNATKDIRTLQRIKERARENPDEFSKALMGGELNPRKEALFNPATYESDEEEEANAAPQNGEKAWPQLPTPQNVVRCPPIKWTQYAIVGESLDKLHEDQKARPSEGMPQILRPDGTLHYGGDGQRRAYDTGVAAPYNPGKDKIERMGTRKNGKR
ncbi:hypothetical protein B7494_g2123 [Chlorociboria aeruginascens]|nr:hypothetical protein B7494_g2123 [Chlorociboria aeruginascens]